MRQDKFSFRRSRGIVWACDLADSSKYLNGDSAAEELERFLPRLHWLGRIAVEAAGGVFLKWTGDGFLAWFETPLHRELAKKARSLFEAIWHITFTANVTQLGTSPSKKFQLRHGVAYEHDALITTITNAEGNGSLDITGRGVVLAFRLSGVRAEFPSIVCEASVAKAAREGGFGYVHFKSWVPTREDLLRYFKGERWGTQSLAISTKKKLRPKKIQSVVQKTKKLLKTMEIDPINELPVDKFSAKYTEAMSRGPQWAKDVHTEELRFLSEDVLETLKIVARINPKTLRTIPNDQE